MRIRTVNLKHAVATLGVVLLLGVPAQAQDQDVLIEKLRTATPEEAANAQRDLEREWSRSGSAAMDLLLKRGREAMAVGDFDVAIDHLTALTDHAPDFAEGFHARATAYFRAELYGPAIDDLERTLALNPQHFNAIFGLAVMFEEFGRTRQAAQLYRRVLALNPHHENATKALEGLKKDGIGRTL
ncbi:tetratricopeptide repeat protein [Sulfitobacter sp. HNIBRBA3233]|uniref:tetratricopeptide repeat protein n=1 Tax=Sulfitobacter marinivivus TaxID=3158558 RepID=UPI0032DE69DF